LRDEAVAKGALVDGRVVKVADVAELLAGLGRGGVVGDLVADRLVQQRAADLTRAADGDVVFGDGKHASREGEAEGHCGMFSHRKDLKLV